MKRMWAVLLALVSPAVLAESAQDAAIRQAVDKSLPLLQVTGPAFWKGSGCISCHNNTIPDMAVELARARGFAVDLAAQQAAARQTAEFLELRRERLLEGLPPSGGQNTMGSLLYTMALTRVPASEVTDASARYQKLLQAPNGSWPVQNHRPPMVASSITLTAMTIRGLDEYAPPAQRAEYARSIRRAVDWLAAAAPKTNEDHAFKILGLAWGGGPRKLVRETAAQLIAQQRADGGWSQLPALESDSYATGQALVALHEAGVATTDPVYARGVAFLLKTQAADGSWHVKSRSEPSQEYFEAGYPYGTDQFISAAGGAWATAALALTRAPSVAALLRR